MFYSQKSRVQDFIEIMSAGIGETAARAMAEKLEGIGFFSAPASTKYHAAYEGGLYDHSCEVTFALLNLTKRLDLRWSRPESPYLVGMLHDLCKCDQYEQNEDGGFSWRADQVLCGHGDKSAILALQLYPLNIEEVMCIRWHMGAYTDKSEWGYLGAAIEQYPNVLYTHTADMIASRIRGV